MVNFWVFFSFFLFPQYILRSQCVSDSTGTSHKLENPVYLNIPGNNSPELNPENESTIP